MRSICSNKVFILRLLQFFIVIAAFLFIMPEALLNAQATQPITITGTVTDSGTGEPLAGVNIVILDTYIGAATDLNGHYSITVPNEKASLCYTFIGYLMETIPVGSQRQINVSLRADVAELEEVIVVGYGVQRKESVVGAVSQVTGDVVTQKVQGSDLATGLQGSIPGLTMVLTTGRPGGFDLHSAPLAEGGTPHNEYGYMYIRGKTTWNESMPLVLVDGVERPLNNINPHEIEKISILKDASATAVFGVKGANGVILITTQRGREGRPRMSVDASMTVKSLSKVPTREGSYTTHLVKNYAILNEAVTDENQWAFLTPARWLDYYRDQTYPEYLPDVNWGKEFVNPFAFDKNVNLSITGGTKVVKYYGALAYLSEGDITAYIDIGQGFKPTYQSDRYNFRSNLDFDITSSTRFSANLSGSHIEQQRPLAGANTWLALWSFPPDLYPVRYSDGTWAFYEAYDRFPNGVYEQSMMGVGLTRQTELNTDFDLRQKFDFITKGLSARGRISFDNRFITRGPNISNPAGDVTKFIMPEIVDYIKPGMSQAEIRELEDQFTIWETPGASATSAFDWTMPPLAYTTEASWDPRTYRSLYYEASLNYTRDFGKHAVTGMGLFSRQERALGSEFPNYREDWVGRTTYSFDRRYLLELNASYNGSEKFSRKYRFGFFPSYAIGWHISNESFFEPIRHIVNNFKLRYSDGKIGSDAGIARWLYVPSWTVLGWTTSASSEDVSRFGWPFLQNSLPLRYEGSIANPDIQWETAVKKNLGFELGVFNNLININYDIFNEHRTGIFIEGNQRYIPDMVGSTPTAANVGIVDSWGWELEFNASKTTQRGFNIWFSNVWTFSKDKVIERGDPELKPEYQKLAGYQIDLPRSYNNQSVHGVMNSWNEVYNTTALTTNTFRLPGDMAIVDFNCDGIIDANDQVPKGYTEIPQYTYSPSIGFEYKNWSANMMFYGVYNVEGTIRTYFGAFPYQFNLIFPWHMERNWSPEFNNTTDAVLGGIRYSTSGTSGNYHQTRAYTKLQHAEVAYKLSPGFAKKIGVSNLKLILSGDNLYIWSKIYEDADAPLTYRGSMRYSYPRTRRYNLKVIFNF